MYSGLKMEDTLSGYFYSSQTIRYGRNSSLRSLAEHTSSNFLLVRELVLLPKQPSK